MKVKKNKDTAENTTVKEWYNVLTIRLENAPREAARFYNLQLLPRLMHQLQKHSTSCESCKEKFDSLDYDTKNIVTWFKDEGKELDNYQKTVESSIKHLQKSHNIFPKGLWLSWIIVISLLLGLFSAYIAHQIAPDTDKKGLIMLGATLGVIIGWIAGKIYEKHLKIKGKLF